MNYFILILVGLGGVWLGRKLALRKTESRFQVVNQERQEQKEEAKKKILEFIRQNGRAKNDDIERMLGVSDATATRYLEELVTEGKIVQKGETSQIFYEIK